MRAAGTTALLGLSVGLGACGDPPYYDSEAFFANTTRESVNVRLLELDAKVDCEAVTGAACERLTSSAFVFEQMYKVGPGQALPLEYEADPWGNQTDETEPACGASVVQIVGVPSTCVFWETEGGANSEQLASVADPAFRRRSIRLEGTKGLYRLAAGAGLESGALLSPATSEPSRSLGLSGRVATSGSALIEAIKELPDGCLALEHRAEPSGQPAARSTIYVCVPRAVFPFFVGSIVTIARTSAVAGAEHLTITETSGNRRLQLLTNARPEDRVPAATLIPLESGYVTRCGAYVEDLGLQIGTGGVLRKGEMSETITAGVRTRVLFGRGERVVVAPRGCEPERASLGTRFDLVTATNLEIDP